MVAGSKEPGAMAKAELAASEATAAAMNLSFMELLLDKRQILGQSGCQVPMPHCGTGTSGQGD
jgi:hypothetical protein